MNQNDNRLEAHQLIDHIFIDLLPQHGMVQRPAQIQLSHEMLDAMLREKIALCDAGTGIGKTFSYLVAAVAAGSLFLLPASPCKMRCRRNIFRCFLMSCRKMAS